MTHDFAEREAVKNVVLEALAAWNRKEARAYASFFAEDAEFTDVVGQFMSGRAEIERLHERVLTTILQNSRLETEEIRVKALRSDVTSIDVWWKTNEDIKPDGTPLPPRSGLLHCIVTKADGKWSIAIAHNVDYTTSYTRQDAVSLSRH